MLSKANEVIEATDTEIIIHSFKRKGLGIAHDRQVYSFAKEEELPFSSSKAPVIILNGQQPEVRRMSFPKTSKKLVAEMIMNELSYYFDETDDIGFFYNVQEENRNNINVLLFCLNYRRINIVQRISRVKLKALYLVQFCMLNYYRSKIRSKNFIFAAVVKGYLYFLYYLDRKLIDAITEKLEGKDAEVQELLLKFVGRKNIVNNELVKDIYTVSCNISLGFIQEFQGLNLIDLGSLDEKALSKIINWSRSYKNG